MVAKAIKRFMSVADHILIDDSTEPQITQEQLIYTKKDVLKIFIKYIKQNSAVFTR